MAHAVLFGSVLLGFALALCTAGGSNAPLSEVSEGVRDIEMRAESGDILFRRKSTFLSNTVLRFDTDGAFSHVGLVRRKGDDVRVIHTIPVSEGGLTEGIQLDTLRSYLQGSETVDYALFRVDDELRSAAMRSADEALNFYERQVPFDTEFRLDSPDRLYCTELVWRAYLQAGVVLLADLEANLTTVPMLPTGVLLPSALLVSPHLRLISMKRNSG